MVHQNWLNRRRRVYEIVETGASADWVGRGYDIISTVILLANLMVTILYTFDQMERNCGGLLLGVEAVSVAFFAVDYILRIWTARFKYPNLEPKQALKKYVLSFTGLVDLLSFLPYYLPIFFPAGTAVFRLFRVVRIFRLFQINAYYNSMNVITEVISSKRQQLMSSVFIILVLMVGSSLCMYSLEHQAQPEVFSNAFSGIWWSVSTLLTVGYGDIYPITTWGKLVGIVITFLGVGMVNEFMKKINIRKSIIATLCFAFALVFFLDSSFATFFISGIYNPNTSLYGKVLIISLCLSRYSSFPAFRFSARGSSILSRIIIIFVYALKGTK